MEHTATEPRGKGGNGGYVAGYGIFREDVGEDVGKESLEASANPEEVDGFGHAGGKKFVLRREFLALRCKMRFKVGLKEFGTETVVDDVKVIRPIIFGGEFPDNAGDFMPRDAAVVVEFSAVEGIE